MLKGNKTLRKVIKMMEYYKDLDLEGLPHWRADGFREEDCHDNADELKNNETYLHECMIYVPQRINVWS